ncbi:MAG TPA: NYN domain-containing protein [Candidatus Limnocylindrales bacterium]|nr:NYN domain-containing protein [Candidatus Limnocylindrales bacterium]
MADETLIAVFVDFENLAIGARDLHSDEFRIELVLKRLLEKGRIVYKRAYCDWQRYRGAIRDFHAQGIELIDIPASKHSGKNSADIRMVCDALDLCHSKGHIDVFALLSGDSDFSPLVSKLKENDKRVIGCGVKASTSDLLVSSCDEFLYYDDLVRTADKKKPRSRGGRGRTRREPASDGHQEALDMLLAIVSSLEEDYDPVWGSLVKQTLRRVYPDFREERYGYSGFADLLRDAESRELIALDYDEGRGNFKIRSKA